MPLRQVLERQAGSPRARIHHWLAALVRRLRGKPPETIESFLARRIAPDRGSPQPPSGLKSHGLAEKLWGGFSTVAKADLQALARSATASKQDRLEALWQLARWHAVELEFEAALYCLTLAAALAPEARLVKRNLQLEVNLLQKTGRRSEAEALRSLGRKRHGSSDTDLCLLAANALCGNADPGADNRRLEWINRIFDRHRLEPIRRIDPARPLEIGNITSSVSDERCVYDGAKVSVIVPAWNAADTIGFALRGLLEQTWRNLEILVVDDASTDGTPALVERVAATDRRVRLIRLTENAGCYAARNSGLEQATGEYVTVHDADDWSHSQKIQLHVEHLRTTGSVGVTSFWVRASPELNFTGGWRPGAGMLDWNLSSLTMATADVRGLGGWDRVRAGGDIEFIRRLEAKYGDEPPRIHRKIPLSFALERGDSLTRHKPTHIRTLYAGVRSEYRRAFEQWHREAVARGKFRVDGANEGRPFPAPNTLLSARKERRGYDVILICDFSMLGGTSKSAYHCVVSALKAGFRVGVVQWSRYDLPVKPIAERLASLIGRFEVDMIVAGDRASTRHLVVMHPPILRHLMDAVPDIEFAKLYMIVNQMAARLYDGGDRQYDPVLVRRNLESAFGTAGEWLGVSPLVRRLMQEDPRYPNPGDTIWTPMIDTAEWCRSEIRWRGGSRSQPVLGRHGRDHYTKWPANRETLRQAYCVGTGWETRFLGGMTNAEKVLGGVPPGWSVRNFSLNPADVIEFLGGIDFLIHFPHENYIEEFGRSAMEAMAVGVPAILPERFREIFGDAAVYCEPAEIARNVEALWRDEQAYLRQARRGRAFVLANCGLDQLARRLD